MPEAVDLSSPQDKQKNKKMKREKKDKKKKKTQENGLKPEPVEAMVQTPPESPDCLETPEHDERGEGDFSNFRISQASIDKLIAKGITYLFSIQAQTFDHVYDGYDVIAQARTGTGKTLSFALPLVEKFQKKDKKPKRGRPPKVLVMAPTRELAKQVSEDFEAVISTEISVACFYGGTPYAPQERAMSSGLDFLVGTPGRILDHIEKGNLDLSKLKHVVLDEVDRMLDMGFADTVDQILKSAFDRGEEKKPQTLLFSATLPSWVYQTAKKYMSDDVKSVDLIGQQLTRTATTVQHLAIKCSYFDRAATLGDIIQVYSGKHGRAMIFCQTKRDADELATSADIKLESHVLHGDIPQDKRETVLKKFKEGRYQVLVTTDVAARGLDVPNVDLVVQCNPPKDVDSYIHRSGRTGRAGRTGVCICFYKPQEEHDLGWVENKAGVKFKKIGAPSPEELIKSVATDTARALDDVTEEVMQYFRECADKLIEEKGASNALAAALAVISGSTKIVSRSLLSSKQGYTTYLFRTNIEMRGTGYCWRGLERHLGEVKEMAQSMRLCKDKMGCVFDMPSEQDDFIQNSWKDGKFDTLVKATELPEIMEWQTDRNSGGGGGGGRGGGGRGRGRFGRGFGNQRGFGGNRNFQNDGNRTFQSGGTFKRKENFGMSSDSSVNKKIKFD